MSVDIMRLSENLSPAQQRSVRAEFDARAKNSTTAFLLCFFLGIFGAHRFYLGQTGQGLLRLIISPLLVPGLIWELVDLFHLDGEVYERNLKLAEDLVARATLAQPNASLEAEALARLDAAMRKQEATETPLAIQAAPDAAYAEPVIASDSAPLASTQEAEPSLWPSAATATLAAETAPLAAPAQHLEDSGDPGAGGPSAQPAPAQLHTWNAAGDELPLASPPSAPADQPDASVPFPATESAEIELSAMEAAAVATKPASVAGSNLPQHSGRLDPTDRGRDPGGPLLVADIGEVRGGVRVLVALPPLRTYDAEIVGAASLVAPVAPPLASPRAWTADAASEVASGMAVVEPEELPTLILYPDEPAGPVLTNATGETPRNDTAQPTTMSGAIGQTVMESEGAALVPESPPQPVDYEAHVTEEEMHDQPSEGARRVVKRVRVVRRLVVNGQVIHEASAEQVVDPDTDTASTAAALQEALGRSDPQTLAALADATASEPPSDAKDQPGDPFLPHS